MRLGLVSGIVLLAACAGTSARHETMPREPASGSPATRELSADDIRAGISRDSAAFERCWVDAIRGVTAPATTRLSITLWITAGGDVDRVSVEGEDPASVSPCIEARARALRFPRSRGPTETTFPMVLDPRSR